MAGVGDQSAGLRCAGLAVVGWWMRFEERRGDGTTLTGRGLVAGLHDHDYATSQMNYDLRRLRLHGLIEQIAHTNTYTLTPDGIRVATFYPKVHDRVLRPLPAVPDQPPAPIELRHRHRRPVSVGDAARRRAAPRRSRHDTMISSVPTSNSTASITTSRSTPTTRPHTLLDCTPFGPRSLSAVAAGKRKTGRRVRRGWSAPHPRNDAESPFSQWGYPLNRTCPGQGGLIGHLHLDWSAQVDTPISQNGIRRP